LQQLQRDSTSPLTTETHQLRCAKCGKTPQTSSRRQLVWIQCESCQSDFHASCVPKHSPGDQPFHCRACSLEFRKK
jgi:hypothetical protein